MPRINRVDVGKTGSDTFILIFLCCSWLRGQEFRSLQNQYTLSVFCFLTSQNTRQGLRILPAEEISKTPNAYAWGFN